MVINTILKLSVAYGWNSKTNPPVVLKEFDQCDIRREIIKHFKYHSSETYHTSILYSIELFNEFKYVYLDNTTLLVINISDNILFPEFIGGIQDTITSYNRQKNLDQIWYYKYMLKNCPLK